jgi:uncharacterized protein (TIGR02246 family)
MSGSRRWFIAVWVAISAQACSSATPQAETKGTTEADSQAAVTAINAVRNQEIGHFSAGHADSVLALFTSDVQFLPPNEAAVQGRDGLAKWMSDTFAAATVSGQYLTSDVTVSGDLAVDRYTGVLTAKPKSGAPAVEEQLKGVHILKKQPDGTWKIAVDVWNTNAPSAPAPPPPAKK